MLTEPLIVALIVASTGIFSSVGLWQYVASRGKKPIDTATALSAIAAQTQSMTLALVEQLQEELSTLRAESATTRGIVTQLQESLRTHQERWESWYRRLMTEWHVVRQRGTPPAPPDFKDWRPGADVDPAVCADKD